MNLRKILTKDVITNDLKGDTKEEIIDSLIDLLASAGKISDRESIKKCIMEREAKMSTGMEAGIAIPHGKSDAVDELVGCVGIKKGGVDFKAFDGQPSRIFIMTISPVHRTGPHVQFLAEISRLLREPDARQKLISAGSDEEIFSIICG
ncbi:MAG TPA: PTS sucrose transporter subunit IIABC [Spirochaeta sp.]|nr:PTS sucrose transporter subunit IIABC [Spirochaeta sp.]